MVSGTLYILNIAPRSAWLPTLASYCGHTVKAMEAKDDPNFKSIFPLGKTPAFISDDGEVVTEMLAIVEYFIINATDESKAEFAGKTKTERVQHLRWMSFLNSDLIMAFVKIVFPRDEATKEEGITLFEKYASYIEGELATGKTRFLAADRILAADIYAYIIIQRIADAGVSYNKYTNIAKYVDAVKTHEIVAQ